MLAVAVQPRNHDRGLLARERADDRADPGVADDGRGAVDQVDEVVVGDELEPFEPGQPVARRRVPVLDDDVVVGAQRRDEVERALERLRMRAECDEDQKIAPRCTALRKRGWSAGHWTKKAVATGWTSRAVSDGSTMREKLST